MIEEKLARVLLLANAPSEPPSTEFIAEVVRLIGPATEEMIRVACGEIAGLRAEITIWNLVADGAVRMRVNGSGEAVFSVEKVA